MADNGLSASENDVFLVTGAAGYLGSHVMVALHEAGHTAIGVDNFCRSTKDVRVALADRLGGPVTLHDLDCRDADGLRRLFAAQHIDGVIHLAGYKSVAESWQRPAAYYDNNVGSAATLFQAADDAGIRRLVFSSSCTVYGQPDRLPVDETAVRRPLSPYGRTKAAIEEMLDCVVTTDPAWSVISLRYFNPIGADPSGLIGEDPRGTPTTLMPNVMAVAAGRRSELAVNGDNHPTPDGSCIRDYIHVADLADAHILALRRLSRDQGHQTLDIATGQGTSVLEMIAACERVLDRPIPVQIGPARPGDVGAVYASGARARTILGWKPTRDLDAMILDHWNWSRRHLSDETVVVA